MAEKELVPYIVHPSQYNPEYEKEVAEYMAKVVPLPKVTKKYKREAPPKFNNDYERELWEREEIRRCRVGYDGLPGKFYFYYNYVFIQKIEGGRIRPEFRGADLEWFRFVEDIQYKQKGWGIICIKRRRVGASWKEAADMLHDIIFNSHFHVGMNSKTEIDSMELFKKVSFVFDHLPSFLRPRVASKANDSLTLGISYVDKEGNKRVKGHQSYIVSKAPTQSAFEGFMLNKWIGDESGKVQNLLQMFAFTEDTMMDEYRRTGMPILFGTVGEVDGKGAGIFELWENAEAYNLKRFFFKGWMGLFVDQYGNDRIEESIRYIVYERKNQEKRGKKAYNDFLQRYPLDEDDAFAISTDGGLGDPAARNRQRGILMTDPPKVNRGYYDYKHLLNKGEPLFIADANGPVFMWESPEDLIDAYAAGCLPPGEKVLTDKGLKNIEEICSKDRLLSKDGEYVKIKEFQQYEVNEDVYEFKIKNTYRTTKFTGEHPLFISDNIKGFNGVKKRAEGAKYSYQKFDFGFKEVKNVKKGEWIKYPNIYKKLKPLDHGLWDNIKLRSDGRIDNPLNNTDFWWFVGHWLGDGHTQVSNTAKKVCISANKAETDTIKKVKHIITTVFGRTPYIRYKNNAVSIEFASTQLFEFLNNNFGKYAHGKYIPEWAKFMDNSYKLALVAGYLDADGSITKDKRNGYYYTEIVSINLELVESIQDILFSLGVISSTSKLRDAKTSKIRGRIINQKVTYRVRIGHYWLNKLIGLGVPSIKVNALPKLENSRSQNMGCFFDSNEDYIYFQILDITKSPYKGKVYNFHCETSTYLSKHITTHNCDPVDPNPEVLPGASLLSFMMRRKPIGLRPATTVMEITYRPKDVTEFYEQVVCALVHYKTKVLIESNRFDMISWFNRNGYKGMILPAPVGMTKITGGRRTQLGVRMIPATKAYMEGLIEAELEHNIEQVPSLKLLNELAVYGAKNTDRIIAWGLTLMQEAEMVNPARASAGTDIFAGLTLERGPNGTLRRVKTKFRKTAQEELPSHIKKRGPGAYVVGSGTTFDV